MTIDEAIKILEQEQHDHHSLNTDIIGQAERLGIEALKLTQKLRDRHILDVMHLLPGEANEEK